MRIISTPKYFTFLLLFTLSALLFNKLNVYAQSPGQKQILDKIKRLQTSDTIVSYTKKLIQKAADEHQASFEAKLLLAQSFIVYTKGDEKAALMYARQAIPLIAPDDSFTYVKTHTMIAYMLSRADKNTEALDTVFKTLKLVDAKGWRKNSIECRICIADIYRSIDQPLKAVPYAQQAADIAKAIKDTSQYIFALSTLSNVYSEHQLQSAANNATATKYMEIILHPPYLKFLSDFEQCRYYSNMGRLYSMDGQDKKAEDALLKAIDIGEKGKFLAIEKHALNEMLTLKTKQHKYNEAIKYGEHAVNILPDDKSTIIQSRDLYERLTDLYSAIKDYEHAFKYQTKARDLKDSLMSIDRASAEAELDDKYRADKRLLVEADKTRLFKQQRNFIIAIGLIVAIVVAGIYRWLMLRRKRKADQLALEHEQLAKMDALKTRFFNNISHELRTPLTLIMGPMDQLVNKVNIDPKLRESYVQIVWRNSKKLLSMVNELLDLGKIETGNLSVKTQPVNLYSFIMVLYQGFVSLAEYKGIVYTINCDIEKHTFAEIDKDKFEKIANNLVSNAIKFTPTLGVVTINAYIKNNTFYFEVIDNGNGIKPADLPHIFERYYQGNHDEMPLEGGTGIGLSIAKEFSILLGGDVSVNSVYGKGTEFKVGIPYIPAKAIESTVEIEPARDLIAISPVISKTQLIMLVEDHAEMVEYIASILSPSYNIVTASNGNEALKTLGAMTTLPDLIISDVMMPGMDGFTLLNKLKQDNVYCRIPVIMLTALADSRNKLKALNTGVDDYLTKPFVSEELLARVTNLLNNLAGRKQLLINDGQSEGAEQEDIEEIAMPEISPSDLSWLSELEKQVRKYTGKNDLNLAILSDEMAISERQLFRRIKTITGLTPNIYIRSIKLQVAREAIESGKYRTLAEISYAAGFDTPAYFSKLFKEHFGREVSDLL